MTNEEKILDILASMSLRFDSLDGRMDSLDGHMDSLNGRMDSLDGRMDSLDGRMDSLEGRMDSMDGRMDSMNGRMDSMDGRMDSMDGRMDSMENAVLKTNIKIETNVETKLDALADGHAAILEQLTPRTRIDDMETEIRFLKTVVYRMSDELQQLKQAQ